MNSGDDCVCPREAGAATCEGRGSDSATPCSVCGDAGKRVDVITLKALLAVSLLEIGSAEYRFCRTPSCDVVYYSVDGAQRFAEAQLRERVYQKHPNDDGVFVCYCFRHTVQGITEDASEHVIAEITSGIQNGQCACDIRNPQGSCCLGNVRTVAKRKAAIADDSP